MKTRDVLVRAVGGEPLHRVAVDAGERVVYITTHDGVPAVERGEREPTEFPKGDVFPYNSISYKELRAQWDAEGRTDSGIWRGLSQYIFSS